MALTRVPTIPALTSIRGLAAWWVVLYHFRSHFPLFGLESLRRFFAEGYLAVDLFFVLSGFVIFLNYSDLFIRIQGTEVLRFLVARVARVYPLHLLVLVAFLVNPLAIILLSHGGQIGERYNLAYFVLSLFLFQNWGLTHSLAWNIPAWSISTEWFAYLVFPIFCLCFSKLERRVTGTLAILMATLLVLCLLFWLCGAHSIGEAIPTLGLPRCVLEFFAGMCICHIFRSKMLLSPVWPFGLWAAAVGLVAIAVVLRIPNYFVVPAACCFAVLATAMQRGVLASLFSLRPLQFLGEISYSTYMVHYFIKDWVNFLLVRSSAPDLLPSAVYLVATLATSMWLFRFVEVPCRRFLISRFAGRFQKNAIEART